MDDNIKKLHQALIDDGYDDVGTEQEFRDYVSDSKNVATLYNALSEAGYDNFKDQKSLETYLSAKAPVAQKPSTPQSSGQSVSAKEKKQTQYPQEVIDAFNSPDNKPGNFKDLAQLNDEYQRGELKKPGIISQALGMFSNVDAGNIGKEQKVGGMIANMLLGDNMQQPHDNNQQVQHLNQDNVPATEQTKPTAKDADAITGAAPVQQVDAIYNKYVGKGDALSETMYDLMASGQAKNQEEAQNMAMGAMNRAASRLAQRTTDEFVSKLGDTVEGVDEAVMNGWHSHAVQDNLKKLASQYGIMNNVAVDENGQYITQTNGYDQFINGMVKPAMVESLVKKYGENYRKTAEDLATRLYSNDEVIQNQLMNQDINAALVDVIGKYVNPSVVEEYNKAQEAGSKAFNEGMEGSQYIPANLRLGTALGAQYEANETKDPAKVLSGLQKKFDKLYQNPRFLTDVAMAAFKVMQGYGMNSGLSGDPKQFKPMINSVLKNELDQLEIKGMMPKGSAEYIMKTGLGNTIVGKITRKAVQTDYQNWLEDIANQQYQPGFWENVASGALTFAGDAWSYWLPGAAGGKLTKSMVAKAEGKLAGDLMAKGMERKIAERAAKVLIGKSKAAALKSGAAHGAVTFGGQSAISKPIDEIYRTGQFDENGKIYNPSVGKVIANTLGEVAKQTAVGAIMQGGTIANMVGKGRGLATNILADIGGKVADSSIMTGQQILERMAHDPNFKPTGKDAAESFLESMANLTAIGLPGMVGKYARFKDAREFNKKFDFSDQDIAELKRFGYDGLRDAFEKMGIGEYAVVGENAQRLDGQLTQKYMNLMNDKSVPEVLKAKMMAVVEGKRPSSFSPIVDSIIVQPMDNDGKVYLETLNKDGGIVERKEFASLDEAQKADKKLEYEKTLGLASVLEGEFHNEFTQEHLDGLYNKAAQKYNMGEKLTDEDKAAVYLHQNAGAIKDIMDKQQKGIILTDEEQKQVNAYRHYYDSALENSSVMREFVNTFEDSHGVARGTLRKALESKDKKYAPLVESYLKELYNSIELKREMKQTMDDLYNTSHGNEQKRIEGENLVSPVEGSSESSAGSQEPPVSEEPAPYQDRTNSVPTPSDAEVAANPANSAAEGAGNEPKVASSDAFVMGQNAYKNGDSEALQAIDYNSDLATGRLKRAFADNEKMPDIVANAYSEGKDMDLFVAQRAGSLTPAQKDAISKYVEAMDAKKGTIDALQHADDGYGEALKQQLWPYQTEDGNIVPATLDSGKQVFLKKANEYGGAFVVVPDEQGQPTIKQVSNAEIKEVGTPVSLDEYIENAVAQQKDARAQQFISQFDGSGLKPNDQVTVAMEEGDANINMTFAGYSKDGKIVLTDGKDYLPLSKEEFAAWRKNALDNTINEHLDAEDDEREQAQIKKAEADKQERYKKGIFGYAAGKPDYSDTQTDPKVAAEYLQETAGEDRKALFANIVAEKQALQKRISQLREHIANNEEWLSLNADLDPENAETRSLANKQMQGQIVDLQARFDQWNKIRSAVMTPEEAEAIKADRTKKIAEAGVNDGDVAPVEGREIAVLSDEELKKQYPTMDEASSYITSERKKIYRIQSDEVQREIDGVDEVLDHYVNGEIDLEPEQLKELNTTKAQLQARQANLTESAKEFKAQADKLKTLYRKENMEARAKAMENMTPAEQRAVKVENAIKTGNLSLLNAIYEEVRGATDFTDTEPNTIEEYVASNIGRFSLNYEGKDKAGVLSNGIKQETGLGRKDFDKLQILAKEGEGKTIPEFVHSLYDNMPEQLKQMGYSDQDIRDAFLNLISSVENYSDLKNYTLNNKVAEAEQQLRTLEHQEEEMMEKATSYEINDETAPFADRLETAISETETNPTEAQKKAGNYKKGHLSFGGYDFTVETPKGVTRSGKDEQGKPWSVTMHDTYGYILGKIGVDGDHIDMFINDAADLDTFDGNVYVVDQVNPETGEFDEHKVMYGYPDEAAATEAYLANYSKGWKGLGKVTSVPKATFDKWLESSDRKTKPFRDYAMIQHEEAKKAKQANEALPFDAPMSMDDLPFHRDMKEVKPSEMTEAQKVAYDAVSTMLKKAGIPVKVVSNEDMEKVAEAQDNLAVEMLLNDPRLRFYIKTPEQKEAAKAAYDWAAKNRPDKFKQYAIVNMDNPNQPPQYFEKKDLAEKWRKYYTNAWKIGNYKAFNLNKPFEEQIKDVKGDVPSEFDPYKAESLLNKRIELEKQIKETEDSYNAKKKERAEYQNQLMQDYMDQHDLSSENDIPDDVWTDYRDKSFEKYQDTLDDLFHKYVELDNQLKAVAEPGVQYLKGKGVVYGYTDGKQIVLNQEHLNPNTPIHEYQHLWRTAAKEMNPELIEHGDKLIMQTQLFADLKQDPNYNHLTDEQICDEAFARLTGEDGAAILEQMAKDAIKENPLDTAKELSVINKLKEWLKKFWYWTLDTFTKWKPEDIKRMTLEDIRNLVLRDLANGVDPRSKLHEAENADEIKFMGSTTKKRMKDISTQLEGRELDEAQQAVADVYSGKKDNVSLTVEREDGSNKIIMRQGNDNHAGTKHSVFRHYGVKANSLNVDDLLLIPTVLKEGERKVSDNGRLAYVYVDPTSQVKYTVVTEPKNNKEFFNDFYSNKKANPSETSRVVENSTNTPEGAHNNDGNAFMRAKVDNNSETAKENGENLSVEDKIKAVSQQFGVDEADVAMYANAIKKGSTSEAARARANIKRHLMQVNEGNIFSFKDVVKYTKPINEALKENFGDLDAMIEERRKQVEAERNAMKAARKRAEEEEAKRQKHLEELSLIPDDQLDKQYMDALAKGDDATAREMLDEAARRKGYDDTESAYQGVGAWAAPGNPGYESDKARRDDWESSGSDVNLEDIALGYTPQPDDYFSHPERYSQNTPHGLESVKAINAAIDAIKNGEKDVKVKVYRAVPTSVKEGKLRNGDWVTPSKKYAEMHGTNRLEGKYRIIEDEVPATQLWWDGNDANEFGFDDGKEYKYKNAKNNRKLNDLVTYDDNGDVIPPSKRFNSRKQDVRFHRVTEPEELERLNKYIVKSPIVEQKLKKHPDSLMKAGTYFSGGGLVEEGLKGIIDPVVAVEYDRKISGVYRNNFGQHIVTADVRDVDPKELVKHIDGEVEYFHASPVCKNYSQAKSNSGEVELDKETAKSTADFIDAVKPRVVTIENVKGYKDSEAMKIITQALDKNGYTWDSDVYNAADYGGYTSRERLIVRAVKDGELPEKPKKQPRKGGWLEAVEDILPTLKVKESGVAPWMDARLKADGIDWQKVEKPLYVMGSAYADGKIPHAYGDEILPTLRTKSGDVIIMPGGKVLRADGRVLARITGLGDDYLLPKTESLAHTIIGNGIPVQLTQGVIAPLLNKDDLSGRNVLARLGSSIFKNNWDADKQKQVSDRVVNTANKLGGAEATVYTSVDEVPDAYLSDVKNGATGWYDPTTHTVHVYLPNCADANEAERTVLHEKIGHEGMEVLLGGEDGVRKFANFVYRSVGKDVRGKIIDFANKYDPDWKNPDRMNVGTQEYIAHLAEEGPKTAEDFSLWTKIKHYLIKVLKKLGVRVPGLLNDKDLRYYLMKAGKALHVWDEMPQEKQEAMMKQASNAEIKDALSDGAGKGKPRQKKGESTIQYMKRVQEWRKWQNAREDKENPEPPMFYDIDKDEAGKKEWAQLNKDWRERHHLVGDEPTGMPIRMENEEDDAYMNRIHEYEKWQAAMKDQEDPLPDIFAFEKKKQEEVKRKYEDWLAKHDLLEQQQADLDLYEGKIYPAETNPKADALEQQVMQDLAEVTSTDVSKEGAARTVKHAVIHRRKNMEEASADDAIYINDVKNRIEKMADSGAFDKLLSDYQGKPNRAEKLAEAIPYIIEAPRRLRDLAHDLNATGAFDKGHIHIQPADVEAIQPYVADLIAETGKKHTELKDGKEVELYDDPQAVSEVASKMAQAINANHQGEEGFVPIDGSDILSEHVLPLVKQQIVPEGIDYKNLSPEMKAAIDSIRDWYNYTYDWLRDNHTLREDTGYNADYVNHIWDKEKSDKQAYAMYVENRQRTKSPNEKPRTISTLMEGISVGLVPKTTDITKMMAYYSRSNIEAWVNKTMLQELSGLNVIERNEDGEIVSSDPLLSSTPPFNLEQYKYFEIPGLGPVWVYKGNAKDYTIPNIITGKKILLYRQKSAAKRFGVVFEQYESSPFWETVDTLASSAKKLELGFSGFHAGALTEVYMVQNMVEFGPKKAMANFMKYIFVDTAKNHELPCFANPEDFQEAASHLVKFGATNDYAAADVQNMFENMRDAMIKVQKKLKDGNKISGTVALATMPLKVATQMLSLINKGMDRALWDFLHDGLKLATYRMRADKTKERAKKKGWTEEELSRALDEDGQFVNDMFGGQHWDVLGASHRTLRYAGRVLLSPDWNASTTRHFLALTGYGSIWNEATFENFKQYYKRLKHKELTPEDEGRRSRQISALLCYGIGFMVFYEGIANGINAAFRALDEEKERKKAEEIRKTNPSYKSMYELAYPDGMKWYDYLMRGNSLGQQSKIFLGRYADGTEMYIRHGKQFREVPEYLFNHKGELEFPGPMVQRMIGKANPMVRMTLDDINYLSDFQASHADQEIQRKYGKTIGLLYKDALYWAPFLIPSQENKEFKAVDFFFPSSKGFSPWKAQSYFKDFILSGDMEGVVMTYQSCQRNGIDPEAQIKAAIGSVKALESAEMSDGVTSLQEASKRFDTAKSITEKKKMRQKMKKFLSQSDYKAFTQKEALDMVQGYLNGDEDLKEMEKAESKYLMKAKAEDVTEDWRIQNVWNGTMQTYQEYQRLKDVDKAKANAFKNSKTNKRLFAARKAISAARRKMNKAKKQMDGTNDAAKLVEIRNTRKELLKTLNGME